MTSLILGYGNTGKSVEKYLKKSNKKYYIFDDSFTDNNTFHDSEYKNIKQVIVSPGINPDHPIIKNAKSKNIKITTDIEIFSEVTKSKIIGVTGTNGKTTFVEILNDLIIKSGHTSVCVGNIGISPLEILFDETKYEYVVLELSSFQIEYTNNLKLDSAIILNIFPDHVDWHKSFIGYAASKLKLFNFKNSRNKRILGSVDKSLINMLPKELIRPSDSNTFNHRFLYDEFINTLLLVCEIYDIDKSDVLDKLNEIPNSPHRLERFHEFNGIEFINDSKATNFKAVYEASKKIDNGLLILHGLNKNVELSNFQISDNIKVVLFPNNMNVQSELSNQNFIKYDSIFEISKVIKDNLDGIDTVLFSCGGSSFNDFQNYQQRGDYFKTTILKDFQ